MMAARFLLALLVTGMVFAFTATVARPVFGFEPAICIGLAAWLISATKFYRAALRP